MKYENANLKEQHLRLEAYGRRDNLMFHNIPEVQGETDVDCYNKVKDTLKKMDLPRSTDKIFISRCHRFGTFRSVSKPRPIIFRLHWYGDRTEIWDHRRKLSGSGIYLTENYPAEIEYRRKILSPIVKECHKQNIHAYLSYDTIVMGSERYNVNTIHRLQGSLNPRKIATPTQNGISAFFTGASPLSNHHVCKIKDTGNIIYDSSEHGYFHLCALELGDEVQATRILNAKTPALAKKEGMKIRGLRESDLYDNNGAKAREMMYRICKMKFSQEQNADLKQFLLGTGSNKLVEGNQNDNRWGVGLNTSNPNIFHEEHWEGENWLGKILERIRDELKDATTVKTVS